jgi:hypothetical protein
MAKQNASETAELFDDVWRRGTYAGFSQNTCGESSTPFLDAFLQHLRRATTTLAKPPKLVELGAGSCGHALRCAREGFPTTAVEYSGIAVTAARARARRHPELPLEIVQADLFSFTSQLRPDQLSGVYANAVFHFLSPDQRRSQYRVLRGALAEGGVLGISFKAHGDALERRGTVEEETAAGPIVRGEDGIRRLFVADAEAIAGEVRGEGYAVDQVIRWSVPGYNVTNESGEFVGFLATR